MSIRFFRSALAIAGLSLLMTHVSTAQSRHARSRLPRVSAPRVIPGLSPAVRASIAGIQAVNVPWYDSLETGAPGWTQNGFWHITTRPQRIAVLSPDINPTLVLLPDSGYLPAAYSGSNVFWYGEDPTGTFIGSDFTQVTQTPLDGGTSYAVNTGYTVTPPINLVGQKTPLLSFWTWWEIEGIATESYDMMYVEVSVDSGATWSPLGRGHINPLNWDVNQDDWKSYSSGGLGLPGKWIREYFDLTQYVGEVVWIRFRFDTIDELYNGFRGWLIDDISVGAAGAPAPTIAQVSPATASTNSESSLLTIVGTNFVSDAAVYVDSTLIDPSSAGVLSTASTQFYLPSSVGPGSHSVRVTNPDGKTAVMLNAFTVTSDYPPALSSITPDSAQVGVSVPITITGSNFVAGATVDIGGLSATSVQVAGGGMQITALSPGKLAAGVYNVTVLNPDGLSDVLVLGFKVFAPSLSVVATGDSLVGNTQPLAITPPASSYQSGKIFFRVGGSSAYDSVALTGTFPGPGPFAVNLPAKAVTVRGVEYYIRLIQPTGGVLTYPKNNPELSPAILPVRVANLATPLVLSPLKYTMFSAPLLLDSPDILSQLGDDYGAYNPGVWRVFHWQSGKYREAVLTAALAGPMPMIPGGAYWLVTATGTPFTFKNGTSVPTVQPYTVPLDSGWNQIADPFAFNVSWSTVGGSSYVEGPYYYDGSQYRIISTVLKPYEGYFVYSSPEGVAGSLLTFYPVESSLAAAYKDAPEVSGLSPGEFVMQISAAIPGTDYRDTYNYVGLRSGASVGKDRLDALKPPPIGDALQVDILDGGKAYLQNFKPAEGEGQSWVFDLRTTGTKGTALVTFTPAGTLPSGYSVHVLDLKEENALPSASGSFEVVLDAPNSPHYYKVIIGTDEYAAKESSGIPLQPVSYALQQNYPNPFNPTTTIRYSLAKRSDVVLEIFNTLGQHVRTLYSGSQTTGEYALVWDGTGDGGSRVASGVYFYRLRTGEFSAVRKLVMIR